MNKKEKHLKRKRYIRDIITGKIINDKEAVSIENIELAYIKGCYGEEKQNE